MCRDEGLMLGSWVLAFTSFSAQLQPCELLITMDTSQKVKLFSQTSTM